MYNINWNKYKKYNIFGGSGLVIPEYVLDKFKIKDLLTFRGVSPNSKKTIDNILKFRYNKIYGKDKSDSKSMNKIILELKQAVYPPYRSKESYFHYGYFGYPKFEYKSALNILKENMEWLIALNDEEVNIIVDDLFLFVIGENFLDLVDMFDKMSEIDEKWDTNWRSIIKNNNDNILDILREKDSDATYSIEILANINNSSELLNNIEEAFNYYSQCETIKNSNLDVKDNDLYESILESVDNFAHGKPLEIIIHKYVEKIVAEQSEFKVGDYFYHYVPRSSRQSYGIAAVGYDIAKKKKIPIFDGEGYPDWPNWLIVQFDRNNFDYSRPDDKIINFFNEYR